MGVVDLMFHYSHNGPSTFLPPMLSEETERVKSLSHGRVRLI